MQHIVVEDSCLKVTDLYTEYKKRRATGGRIATIHQRQPAENAYQKQTEQFLSEENCFKIMIVSL